MAPPLTEAPTETVLDPPVFSASGTRPLADQLIEAAQTWASGQHQLITLAAEFADSAEWVLAGAPTAAHWLAEVADVEACTAREWIRIGRKLQGLRLVADAYVITGEWPTVAQQQADAVEELLTERAGTIDTEVVIHVRGDGNTLDDGTPINQTAVEQIAPTSFIRALIHGVDGKPVDATNKRRHPTDRQKRVVKERDRQCVDCGRRDLLEYDHNPAHEETGHTVTTELKLRCAPCHDARHASQHSAVALANRA